MGEEEPLSDDKTSSYTPMKKANALRIPEKKVPGGLLPGLVTPNSWSLALAVPLFPCSWLRS
jgi:hypothetical protein